MKNLIRIYKQSCAGWLYVSYPEGNKSQWPRAQIFPKGINLNGRGRQAHGYMNG